MNTSSRNTKTFLLLTPAFVLAASTFLPANAFTVTAGGTTAGDGSFLTTSRSGATVNTFDSPTPIVTGTYSGGATVTGFSSGIYAQPLNDPTSYYTVGSPGISLNTATITMNGLYKYFGLYWGSIDNYNNISFYKDNVLIAAYNGSQLGVTANGGQFSPASNDYINFDAVNSSEYFNKIEFSSSSPAFESDNHAFIKAVPEAVPEPTSVLGLFVVGALGVGSLIKRKI